jgi:calpain-15
VTPVIVDDWFPTVYGKAAFCSSTTGELWGMLFEKAWAKLHGSYGRTSGGQTTHAAQHMTGLPAKAFKHNEEGDKNAFFKKMLRFDNDHCTMLASSPDGTNDKKVNGIV